MTDTVTDQPTADTDSAPAKPRRTMAERAADDLAAARRRLERSEQRVAALRAEADEVDASLTLLRARVDYLAANPLLA